MGSNLEVDIGGVRSVSSASTEIAATLARGGAAPQITSSRRSDLGIAALDVASGAVRTRQADRIAGQAADLSSASTRYAAADDDNAYALDEKM
ncbi:hypothetical protein [Mycolicibacterium cosmeticum]|uniref:hypothetical protein n=1 Tax=Mycolicibacterium cosmeticum TaxID=258533 RepID=UPI00104038B7|nr:hypothetical protein [Mycolicibacterium cosmeticum]